MTPTPKLPFGYAHWEERIKDLMKQLPLPYSRSIAEAMNQLVNEMMQATPPAAQRTKLQVHCSQCGKISGLDEWDIHTCSPQTKEQK